MNKNDHQEIGFRKLLDKSLRIFFMRVVRITVKDPKQAYFFLKTVRWQKKAARLRSTWQKEGTQVPPMMIFSVTNRSNLHCVRCYHQALNRSSDPEMSLDRLRSVFFEASQLGISFCILAGGEPLVREEIVEITRDFPKMIFLVFANGLLLNDSLLLRLKKQHNFVPVISAEGNIEPCPFAPYSDTNLKDSSLKEALQSDF